MRTIFLDPDIIFFLGQKQSSVTTTFKNLLDEGKMFIFNVLIWEFIAKELKRGLLKICFDIGMWRANKFDVHFVRDLESLHFFQSWSATSQLSNVTGFSFQHEPSPLHPRNVWHCQNGYFLEKVQTAFDHPPPLVLGFFIALVS